MRILLINPPLTRPADITTRVGICPPLGLAYMAAVLERAGHRVRIFDALLDEIHESDMRMSSACEVYRRYGSTDWAIKANIEQFAPDLVGVTCPFVNREWDTFNVCRIAKSVNHHIRTVIGGAHPSCTPTKFLLDPCVDHVVCGEGEDAILSIVDHKCDSWGKVSAQPIPDLDSIPMPARHLLPMQNYLTSTSPHSGYLRTPYTSIITSRGCPNKCRFCVIRQIWGNKCRYRSPDNVLAEVDHLVNTYHIKELHFEDDNFLAHKTRALDILQRITVYKIALASPSGLAVATLDSEMLGAMYKAGYYSVSLAVESGVQATLRLMQKPVNLKEVSNVVHTAQGLGLRVKAFFIIGYPGESKDDIRRTVDFAASLGLDWAIFFPATAIPGSAMEAGCRARNWLVPQEPARFFSKPNIRTDEFGPEDVVRWVEEANEQVNGQSKWKEQLAEVVRNYPDLEWAKEALNGTSKTVF